MQVDDDHLFHGFDAYKKVIESDVDVVLIARHHTSSRSTLAMMIQLVPGT